MTLIWFTQCLTSLAHGQGYGTHKQKHFLHGCPLQSLPQLRQPSPIGQAFKFTVSASARCMITLQPTLSAHSRSSWLWLAEMQMRALADRRGVAGKPTTTIAIPLSSNSRDVDTILPGLKSMTGCRPDTHSLGCFVVCTFLSVTQMATDTMILPVSKAGRGQNSLADDQVACNMLVQ